MHQSQKSGPFVSVIMSVYNGELYLREAIDSMLTQTMRDFEFIIVNDASTDGTAPILSSYTDPRMVLLSNPTNQGMASSFRRAIDFAHGKYLARMDADDVSLPHRLQTQVTFLETHPDIAVVGSAAELIDEKGVRIGTKRKPNSSTEIAFKLLLQTQIIHPSACMRKSAYDDIGGYDDITYKRYAEDLDLWNRFVEAGYKLSNLPETLIKYRIHSQSVSVNDPAGTQSERAFHVNEKNLRRYLPFISRNQVMLLSKLVNRPHLTFRELCPALSLYKKLSDKYITLEHLTDVEKSEVQEIRRAWTRHTVRNKIKSFSPS
jgi:glycosyltransferase involved in cell wall biosynthesis